MSKRVTSGLGGYSLKKQAAVNVGASIIRIGFWGKLHYNHNHEGTPTIVLVIGNW